MEALKIIITACEIFKTRIRIHFASFGLVVALLSLGNRQAFSQIKPKSIRISFYNETTALPSARLFRFPIHPGVVVGSDFLIKTGKHWQTSLGTDLTFYHHRMSENAIVLDAMYALGFRFGFGLQLKLITGAGYKHSFLPGDVFKFENGKYRKVTDWGTAHFNFNLGYGLEFPLSKKISVTADYKCMVALPYSESLPFSVHSFTGIGLKTIISNNREIIKNSK